jgi:hypothetical protein
MLHQANAQARAVRAFWPLTWAQMPRRFRFNFQTAKRHRPVFWSGDGAPVFLSPGQAQGGGAPNGAPTDHAARASVRSLPALSVGIPVKDAAPIGAPRR